MAVVSSSSPLYGARGLVGGLVFRAVGEKTVVSQYEAPSRRRRKQSELQQLTRSRFSEASRYAKAVLRDPVKQAYYVRKAKKLGLTSAYTAAITDFMRRGKIERVDTSKVLRTGVVTIRTAKQGFSMARVRVRLTGAGGKEVGEGMAVHEGAGAWRYRFPEGLAGLVNVWVEARDSAGNVVEECVLSDRLADGFRAFGG